MPKTIQSDQEILPEELYTVESLLEHVSEYGVKGLDVGRLRRTPAYTLANFLNRLSVDECRAILRLVPELDASEILSEMDADASAEIVAAMREWRALKILEEFEPDDAADVISELEEPDRVRLLSKLEPETASKVRALLQYDPETAGGVMNPNYIAVKMGLSVDQAIASIRKQLDEIGVHTSYVYVLDERLTLKGVVSLEQLIIAKPTQMIKDIMETELKGVCTPNEDREKIALSMGELNLFDLPVVDAQGRLLGIVEHDDVIDIIQQEATEDFQKLVGAGADEAIHDDISYSIRRRGPWLFVNLITALVAAAVISMFQSQIEKISLLAVFMQAVASLGGNTGAQTLAVSIRSIAMGDVQDFDNFMICLREGLKGILNGVFIGIVGAVAVYFFTKEIKMSLVVFFAMVLNMGLGGVAGAFIPLMLRRLGFDPAQSSSIFLTGTTDVCGFFIFLSLGTWLLF